MFKTKKLCQLTVALLAITLTVPALADWDPDQPAKWVQFPDLSPMGIDVAATHPFVLADDWPCETPGPITEIHIWGSWLYDYIPFGECPECMDFILSIHRDIPAEDSPTGYSMPGELLWMRVFVPGEFSARVWAGGIEEGWMFPPDVYFFPADWTCWQYNFYINPDEAFFQEGTPDNPMVYWLDVQAIPHDPEAWFGWKTSVDHWNDNAVWGTGVEPYPGPWQELVYPPNHELYGQPIDLAFVITTEEQPPEDLDFGDAPDPAFPTLLANDGARHVIVPNAFMGNLIDAEMDGQPVPPALGDDLTALPDEDGVIFLTPFIQGQMAQVNVTVSISGYLYLWIDWDLDGTWTQADNQVFADLGVSAGTTTLNINVPPTAVPGVTYARFRYTTVGGLGLSYTGLAPSGEVEDYELFVEPGEPEPFYFEFSLDIGSDIELSDPFVNGNEAADPGDVYLWKSAPIFPPGRDGFKDDALIFGFDLMPDPPDGASPPATRVPVGMGHPGMYHEYFDLDGHDQLDLPLEEFGLYGQPIPGPIPIGPTPCLHYAEHLFISFDDDMAPGWPVADVPVVVPSPMGMVHGTTAGKDEVLGVSIPPVGFPVPPIMIYPFADEDDVHASLAPNPDASEEQDDDVDSLDVVFEPAACPFWYFTCDHEATGFDPFTGAALDPGDVYRVLPGGGVLLIVDDVINLGLPDEVDLDAIEFAFRFDPVFGPGLILLFSVDDDDPLTPGDESGGLPPDMIWASYMMGFSFPLVDPLGDDIDAITVWDHPIMPCCPGDTNCDGVIDFKDINPFVIGLTGGPMCNPCNFDINQDGAINFKDINPFVALLTSAPLPIPCP